jgi:hypothetical protein
MGFFSKIGKGIKSAFKSIGKGIKSAFKRFGKFMSKIGVLGQVALMFILPGVGNMIASAWSGIAGQTAAQAAAATAGQAAATTAAAGGATTAAATTTGANVAAKVTETIAKGSVKNASAQAVAAKTLALGSSKATGLMAGGNFAQGVGKLMQFTGKVVGTPGRVFSNITQGVTDTLGNFAKTASNNIFGTKFTTAAGNSLNGKFFGAGDSAFGRSFGDTSKFANVLAKSPTIATKQAASNFQATADSLAKLPQSSLNTEGLPSNMSPSQSPMKQLQDSTFGKNQPDYSVGSKPFSDLSQPIKDIDTAQFSGDGGKSLIANKYPDSQAAFNTRVNPYDDPKFNFNANDPALLADASGSVSPVQAKKMSGDYPDFGVKTTGDLPGIDPAKLNFTKLGDTDFVAQANQPSLLGQATDRLQEGFSKGFDKVKTVGGEYLDDPIGKTGDLLFGGFKESLQQGIQYKAKEALGLTPDMPDQYVTNTSAYVPSFDTGGGAGSYQAPETMNARAFEQNVLAAPSQYGYTAFQYDQYMNRTAQA